MAQLRGDRGSTSLYGLNRRDIDVLLKDWCNSHRDLLGSRRPEDSQLEAVGKFMMAIGAKLDEPDGECFALVSAMDSGCSVNAVPDELGTGVELVPRSLGFNPNRDLRGINGFIAAQNCHASNLKGTFFLLTS